MPLDSFGISTKESIPILVNYIKEEELIHREIATDRDQGKNVIPDPSSEEEQKFVSSNAKEIKKCFKLEDDGLKEMIEHGLNIMTEVDSKKGEVQMNDDGRIIRIEIGYTLDRNSFVAIDVPRCFEECQRVSNGGGRKRIFYQGATRVSCPFCASVQGEEIDGE